MDQYVPWGYITGEVHFTEYQPVLSILSNELTNQQFLGEGPESKALLDLGLQVVYAPMVMIHQWYEVMGELRETLL